MNKYQSLCYCTNLRKSANILSGFYDEALKESGISVSQYYLLIRLSNLGSGNITHWADSVGLDRSTMVRNIKLLQSRDLIEEIEGHGKVFALSGKGQEALQTALPLWKKAQAQTEEILGKEDADAVLRIGTKLMNYC